MVMEKEVEHVEKVPPPTAPAAPEQLAQDEPTKPENLNNESFEAGEKAASPPPMVFSEKSEKPDILDPFMVYQVVDIFKFNAELSKTAKIAVKTSGKFIRVFPESDADVIVIAEFLKLQNIGYYIKAIYDYPLRAVIKDLPYNCSTELISENLQQLGK